MSRRSSAATNGADGGPASLTCYQFGNALGTALLELDERAEIHSYEEYHPFGTTALQSVSALRRVLPKRYRFTGKERDAETGLYYQGARYYAPWLGRWTAPDPAGAADGQNLYAYAGNRPIGSSDPTGLWERPSWRTVAVIAAVVVVGAVVTVATAGVAGPVIAGAIASVGLTGTAATVATGVAVGAVSGAVAGAAAGAAGEATRQTVNSRALGLGTEEFSGRAILREAGSGAVTGAAIGAAVGGAAAFAASATGAAAIGAAGRVATAATRAVVPAAVRSAAASAGRAVAGAAGRAATRFGSTAAGSVVRRGAERVASRLAALEAASTRRGLEASRALFRPGSAGAMAAERNAAETLARVGGAEASRATARAERAGIMRSPSELMGVEPASPELLAAVGRRRSVVIAHPGTEEARFLDYFGAEASAGGVNNSSIVLRPNPSKAAVLEEFLHGTQARLGIIDRLGRTGLGSAETHVKDFMIRHQRLLGLGSEDVRILQILRDKGL